MTLVELLVATTSASLLAVGMMSSIYLATRAAETNQTTMNIVNNGMALEEFANEMRQALQFTVRAPCCVEFRVADRDGDSLPETIRYSWSEAPGSPLKRSYNGATEADVIESVHSLSLAYRFASARERPRVLLVVPDASNLNVQDARRKAILESYGFLVNTKSAGDSQRSFDAATAGVAVAYVSKEVAAGELGVKLAQTPIGVIHEQSELNDEFCISSGGGTRAGSQINIVNNSHEITAGFALGAVSICSSSQTLIRTDGAVAGGAQTLAEHVSGTDKALVVIDQGGAIIGGGMAKGRRVLTPWGGSPFDVFSLTDDGMKLLQRAVDWAAGSFVLTRVEIMLQTGTDSPITLQTDVEVLNEPRAANP